MKQSEEQKNKLHKLFQKKEKKNYNSEQKQKRRFNRIVVALEAGGWNTWEARIKARELLKLKFKEK